MEFFSKRLKTNLLISLFVFAFLFIYQPFNISRWDFPEVLFYCAGYGLCTLLGLLLAKWPLNLLGIEQFSHKKAPKQVLSSFVHITAISTFNFIYSFIIGVIPVSWQGFLLFFAFTMAVAVFPTLALFLPKFRNQPARSNDSIQNAGEKWIKNRDIQLHGENKDETFTTPIKDLLFIKSELNYCEIYYLRNNELRKHLIRATIKDLQNQISHAAVQRVHRSFLCNLSNVENWKYKNQKLYLYFPKIDKAINCSRSKNREVKKKLEKESSLNFNY